MKSNYKKIFCYRRMAALALIFCLASGPLLASGAQDPFVIDENSPDIVIAGGSSNVTTVSGDDEGADPEAGDEGASGSTVTEEPAEPPTVYLSIEDAPDQIAVGEECRLSYALKNSDADVAWSSSDKSIAAIDGNGKVTGITPGMVQITATAGDVRATVMITVVQPSATAIKIIVEGFDDFEAARPIHDIHVGDVLKMSASALPEGSLTGGVTWSVSNPELATIDRSGMLVVKAKGGLTVSATAGEIGDKIVFNILPNGMDMSSLLRYIIIGVLVLILIIAIIVFVVVRNRQIREEEKRRRRAARRRREAERAAMMEAEGEYEEFYEEYEQGMYDAPAGARNDDYMRRYDDGYDHRQGPEDGTAGIYDADALGNNMPKGYY